MLTLFRKAAASKLSRPIIAGLTTGSMLVSTALVASADETTPALSANTFSGVTEALTGQIQVSTIVGVIAAVLGITVGFAFMWWGGRYAVRKIWGAIKKGRASV